MATVFLNFTYIFVIFNPESDCQYVSDINIL